MKFRMWLLNLLTSGPFKVELPPETKEVRTFEYVSACLKHLEPVPLIDFHDGSYECEVCSASKHMMQYFQDHSGKLARHDVRIRRVKLEAYNDPEEKNTGKVRSIKLPENWHEK